MMFTRFLKPTPVKLALLLPGAAFILLEMFLEPQDLVAALPGLAIWAILYYLVASLALTVDRRGLSPARFRRLMAGALLLATLDQAVKLIVLRRIPLGQELALIPGALTLTHAHNPRGSWLAVAFDLDFLDEPLLILVALLVLILAPSLYRYYVDRQGHLRLWPAVALVGFVAGLSSAVVDLTIRGFTVDYLGVTGLVVADLKDFYVHVATAAFLAEVAATYPAARRLSNRQLLAHLQAALAMSVHELKEQFHPDRP